METPPSYELSCLVERLCTFAGTHAESLGWVRQAAAGEQFDGDRMRRACGWLARARARLDLCAYALAWPRAEPIEVPASVRDRAMGVHAATLELASAGDALEATRAQVACGETTQRALILALMEYLDCSERFDVHLEELLVELDVHGGQLRA
jgi:hypothetical protein